MLTLLGLVAAAVFSGQLQSASGEEPLPTKIVRYDDLNLGSPAGQRRLQLRVKYAARSVCGEPNRLDIGEMNAARECRTQAEASAMPQLQLAIAGASAGPQLAISISTPANGHRIR